MAAYRYPDISDGEWTRRIAAAAHCFRAGDIDHTLCLVAFGGDAALFTEAMRRITAGTADPAAFVPFGSHTSARHT